MFWLILIALQVHAQTTQEVIDLFNAGQAAHKRGQYEEALKLYSQAIALDDQQYQIHYQRGMALLSLKRPQEAVQSFQKVVKLAPSFAKGWNAYGQSEQQTGDLKGAALAFAKAIELDANLAAAHADYGLLLIQQAQNTPGATADQWKPARQELEAAFRLGDHSPRLTNALASLRALTGDHAGAIELLNLAIAADANNTELRLARAKELTAQRDFTAAALDLKAIYDARPTSEAALNLSAGYAAAGQNDLAISALGDYLRIDAHAEKVLAQYASLLIEANRGAEAEDALTKFAGAQPADPALLIMLGDLYATKDPGRAVKLYAQAVSLTKSSDKNGYAARLKLGSALLRAHQREQAVAILQTVVRERPDDYTAHANLATALFESKVFPPSVMEYEWLVAHAPGSAQKAIAYYFLALSHDNLQEYELALPAYESFLKLADPVVNKNEIDAANFRLPGLRRLIQEKKGKHG